MVDCYDCYKEIVPPEARVTAGTGSTRMLRADGTHYICYPCCAKRDRADMIETGRFRGYLLEPDFRHAYRRVTNWSGSLVFQAGRYIERRHNWGGEQTYVWFYGPEERVWLGRHVGDTDVIRCRRLKRRTLYP